MAPFLSLLAVLCVLFTSLVSSFVVEDRHKQADNKGHCGHDIHHILSCKDDSSNTQTEGISQELLDQFHLMAEYAAASYWPINNNSTGTPLSCSDSTCPKVPEGNCPQVEAAGAYTLTEFKDTPTFDDHGYIAVDPTNKLIVLAFRGSQSSRNWWEDFKIDKVHVKEFCKKCKVHHGFWESWVGMRTMVMENVLKAISAYPDHRFVVVGHSLGAALATLAAGNIRTLSPWFRERTELFTFASPRVGDKHTAVFLTEQSNLSYRITAGQDPVPRLPGAVLRYMHTSPEYWIRHNPYPAIPVPADFRVCTGFYNSHCNSGTHAWGFGAHRKYFGFMTGCDKHRPKGAGNVVSGIVAGLT